MTEALPVPLSVDDEKEKIGASTSSSPDPNDDVYIDPAIERRTIRKCDYRVIPPTLILFMLSFLDRVNIGNAVIQGLPEDLALVGHQFNVALLILFIPFILLEIPSNIVMKRVNPSTWLSIALFGCGKNPFLKLELKQRTESQHRNYEHVHGLRKLLWRFSGRTFPARHLRSSNWAWHDLLDFHVLSSRRASLEAVLVVLLWHHCGLLWWFVGIRNSAYGWHSRI